MQMVSSAWRRYSASASASEYTATVSMPISRQVRITRWAISPRLAISTRRNMRRWIPFSRPSVARAKSARPERQGARAGLRAGLRAVLSGGLDEEQGLTELDGLAVLDEHVDDHARGLGADLVQHLHGLDDADHRVRLDALAD